MIVFATQIGREDDEQKWARWGRPGAVRAATHGDLIVEVRGTRSVARSYNQVLDLAPEGAWVAFVHPDTEIQVEKLGEKLAKVLEAEPQVGVVGPIGAEGVTSLRWWEGKGHGWVHHEQGGVYFDQAHLVPVDTLDGLLLILSPLAALTLRFDLGYEVEGAFMAHGYDGDICRKSREAGFVNLVIALPTQHHTYGGYGDKALFDRANERFRCS